MAKQPVPFDESVYRSARSTRPAWANALIVAGVILIAWLLAVVFGGFTAVAWILLLAAIAVAIVGGILALTRVRR